MASLPVDNHEALVIQTAQEMQARDDWILPWFNGKPRLNKPPLSYWLTGIAANLFDDGGTYKAWHGRLVSLLAGLGLVACTLLTGRLVFNYRIAILSSFIMVTTSGWFSYTHDARPDMLYAFTCALGVTGFLAALISSESKYTLFFSLLGWTGMALATLTKGPHMPLAYLAGILILAYTLHIPGSEIIRRLNPLRGLVIFTLLSVPWWLLVSQHPDIKGLENTQLSGSLLTMHPSNLMDFYYFYRPLILLLPWFLLLPFTLIRIKYSGLDTGIIFSIIMIVLPALMLETGPQKRWYYLLPSLVPMCLLLGAGMETLGEMIRGRKTAALLVILCALTIALITILYYQSGNPGTVADKTVTTMTILFLTAITYLSITAFRLDSASVFPVLFSIFFVTYLYLGNTLSGWSSDRFDRKILSGKILSISEAESRYFSIGIEPGVYTFHTGRTIETGWTLAEIEAVRHRQSVVLLSNPAILDSLPDDYQLIGKVKSAKKVTDIAVFAPRI